MWTLHLMSGKDFEITQEEAESLLFLSKEGAKLVKVRNGLIINPSTISEIVSDEEMMNLNPIINDPDFRLMGSEDYPTKNRAMERLDRKYPLPKFEKEWEEAHASLHSLTV